MPAIFTSSTDSAGLTFICIFFKRGCQNNPTKSKIPNWYFIGNYGIV